MKIHHVLLLALLPSLTVAEEMRSLCECGKQHLMPPSNYNLPGRKYARDRLADIKHVSLDVVPNFKDRSLAATMQMSLSPIGLPLRKFELDAVGLEIAKVQAEPPLAEWQNTGEKLVLWFREDVAPETPVQLSVTYSVTPTDGIYFRTPEMGYPATDTQLWTQGEAELHRHWFPCYDFPNERFTSEIKCTVPDGMSVTSNGVLLGKQAAGGQTTWHWKQEQPHVNYLIALAAGYFHRLENRVGDLPLALLVPPSLERTAALAFIDTQDIMTFLQAEIGVPFPWAKYDQVYCHDFLAGGMENTSCSFMAASELFVPELETLENLRGLDAHEMTHQWFGDLVTCRDWSHLWLNEGFASFYPMLYERKREGEDAWQGELWRAANRVIESNDLRPIVWKDYGNPMQQFDSRAYPKGAWVLNMLRAQLGPELFRKGIAAYLTKHRNGIATSDDLQEVLEEVSGRSFDRFFDQWLHHGGVPHLAASHRWDAKTKLLTVTVRQSQKVENTVPLFHVPLPIRFVLPGKAAPILHQVEVTQEEENFTFSLPAAPVRVECDPDFTVLAKWSGDTTLGEKHAALDGPLHGRVRHIRALADNKSKEALDALRKVLVADASVFCRTEAAEALQKHQTEESMATLIPLLSAPEARVRQAVSRAVASSSLPVARAALAGRLEQEKNPQILATIIQSWSGQSADSQQVAKLIALVDSTSWQDMVAAAAIQALRSRDETSALPQILKKLAASRNTMTSRAYSVALDDAAFLARNQPEPKDLFMLLAADLQSPREGLRVAAAKALGTLGQPVGVQYLKPLTAGKKPFKDPVKEAAEASLTKIQSKEVGSPALEKVWAELQSLKEKNTSLEKELKKLKEAKP
jgi:aminopeptidase N